MLVSIRTRGSGSNSPALLQPPSPASSQESPSTTDSHPRTWKESGFSFIPIRRAHLDFLAFAYGEDAVPISQCVGNAMVDRWFQPLGFCLVWARPEGSCTLHAHFGKWLQVFPKDILRSMHEVANRIRAAGVTELWMIADESIEGSTKLCEWLGAERSEQYVDGQGWYWRHDLSKSKI